ncbi:GTP cyclohydrolase [Clostridium sp. 19966]|uniref:YciI family protein n=1 Tax=Clostridium sp. 19966 TaxID=2768166 RepID=UPI0028DD8A9D|nr:YciI family protein [Clostridium sp. 19966]MDT8716855.1 GTP cyclohydrolase [Clostridium sp. 19966]
MFIIILKYKKALKEVEKHLEAHVKFLDKYYALNKFICSGRQQPRVGGVVICNAKDKEEAKLIMQEDPFYKNDVAEYEVIEFVPTKYKEGFEKFIE